MKTLYLKCKMGCAGDMLMGALSELVDQNAFVETMNHIGLENIEYQVQSSVKCGICGTHMKITAYGLEEKPDHHHDATFYFQIENTDDHKIHHILDHIEEIEAFMMFHMKMEHCPIRLIMIMVMLPKTKCVRYSWIIFQKLLSILMVMLIMNMKVTMAIMDCMLKT